MNKKAGIYHYLETSGVLDSGNETAIALARTQYRREYQANWRRQKRKEQKEYTIAFSKKEVTIISAAAKKHHRSNTRFIKEAALAYCQNQYLMPDPTSINLIHEAITLTCTAIQRLEEDSHISEKTEQRLIEKLEVLEQVITEKLNKPMTIAQALKETIQNNPEQKSYLLNMLKNETS